MIVWVGPLKFRVVHAPKRAISPVRTVHDVRRDQETEERRYQAQRRQQRLAGIATRDVRDPNFEFEIAAKRAAADHAHKEAMARQDRAAAMDAVARAPSTWW